MAVKHYCRAHNFTVQKGGRSPWYARCEDDFKGKKIPVGAMIAFSPLHTTNLGQQLQESKHKLDARGLGGHFMGYDMHSGELWSKRYVVMLYSQSEGIDFTKNRPKEGKLWYLHH